MDVNLLGLLDRVHPVLAAVIAVLLIIVGFLVLVYPVLVAWFVGIGLILAGVAALAGFVTSGGRGQR